MEKWIFSLALTYFLTLSTPQMMEDHQHHQVPDKFAPHEHGYLRPDSVRQNYLSVKGAQIRGFQGSSREKLEAAFQVLETAVNSEEFKDRVINFRNTKGERSFASNNGLTNEEIYELFMEGREILQPDTPGEMNFHLELYHRPWSRVIGYTSPKTNVISVNWKYFRNFEPHEVAANLAHEWTHKMGFDHRSAKEHDSAPYAIGYIAGDIASKLLRNSHLH